MADDRIDLSPIGSSFRNVMSQFAKAMTPESPATIAGARGKELENRAAEAANNILLNPQASKDDRLRALMLLRKTPSLTTMLSPETQDRYLSIQESKAKKPASSSYVRVENPETGEITLQPKEMVAATGTPVKFAKAFDLKPQSFEDQDYVRNTVAEVANTLKGTNNFDSTDVDNKVVEKVIDEANKLKKKGISAREAIAQVMADQENLFNFDWGILGDDITLSEETKKVPSSKRAVAEEKRQEAKSSSLSKFEKYKRK